MAQELLDLAGGALPTARGGWGTVCADPPWSFRDRGSRIAPDAEARRGGAVKRIYGTMPTSWVARLPVASIVAPASHLYLWVPSALLEDGLVVMKAWGFSLKTTVVWGKRTRHGRPAFGAGHYFRGAHELVLFGVRGRCPALSRRERTYFEAEIGEHSVKPELLQDMAERVSPGPRLELFARRRRAGWTCFGDQLPAELPATGTGG